MSKQTITIQFQNIVQLWQYAQTINCHSMEIIVADRILICECPESDIAILSKYGGLVVEDYHPVRKYSISNNQ
jgi:hypothetical protein